MRAFLHTWFVATFPPGFGARMILKILFYSNTLSNKTRTKLFLAHILLYGKTEGVRPNTLCQHGSGA